MKRLVILLLSISFFTIQSCSKNDSQPTKPLVKKAPDGGKVSVDVEFGSGPWCILPGVCSISIDIEWGLASNDGNGNLVLEFTGEALQGKDHGQEIIDNYNEGSGFVVDEPYDIDPVLADDLNLTDVHIEPESYPMTYDSETDTYTVTF